MRAQKRLEQTLKAFVTDNGWQWPDKAVVEPPKDKQFGDMAANLAMVLAPQAKAAPRATAERIKEYVEVNCADVSRVDIAGPGFINVTFTPAFWQATVAEVLSLGEKYGTTQTGNRKKVMVEYVSANPTGPLHIGHGRGAAVGDSLARILRATGHDVSTEYYVNDAGRQMRLLGTSVWVRLQQAQGRDVELPDDCYKGDYIRDIATLALEKGGSELLEQNEAEAIEFCKQVAMADILAGIRADLEEFGCEHQVWFSEKSLLDAGKIEETFELLKSQGRAYEKDGAVWFKSTDFGDDKDRVLRKSDGSLTYFASDIAYHDDKYRRGFDLAIDIWGADHHGYVPRMSAAVQALGRDADALHVILVQLVNLLQGGEQIAMSTRAGKFETLADVCKEVGVDAARFTFLSRKSDSHLDFDLELVKQRSMDNPVYYVQYAHARINSVFRKAAEQDVAMGEPDAKLSALLDTDVDLDLLRCLEQFPDALETASRSMSPHHVSYYLSELAGLLHRYYTMNQILAAPDEATVRARMQLMAATAQVIRNGLALIGVSAPEAM